MKHQRIKDWAVVLFSVLLTIACISLLGRLHIDSSTDAFIPQDAEVVKTNHLIEDTFGYQDAMVVSLLSKDGTILTTQYLDYLGRFTAKIGEFEGVKQADSLANLTHLRPNDTGLEAVDLYTNKKIDELNANLQDWPQLYEGTFLSKDRSMATILVQLQAAADSSAILSQMKSSAQELGPPEGLSISYLGLPTVTAQIEQSLLSDLARLGPIVGFLIIIVLFFYFRRLEAVLLCLVPLIVSSALMLGLMAVFSITFTLATMLVPILLLIVGSAYTIHILSHFYQEYENTHDLHESVKKVIHKHTFPVLGAGTTTAVGFLAQISSPLQPFRMFGLICFLGVFSCIFAALSILPALIRLFYTTHSPRPVKKLGMQFSIAKGWEKPILFFWAAVFILLPFSFARIQAGTNLLDFFKPNSSLVKSNNLYNEKMQGSFSLSVMVQKKDLLDPQFLSQLDKAIQTIEKKPEVGGVQSIIPFIKRMNHLLGPGEQEVQVAPSTDEPVFDFFSQDSGFPEASSIAADNATYESAGGQGPYEIPTDPLRYGLENDADLASLIAQYLLLYSSSLDQFINDPLEPDATLFTILLKKSNADMMEALIREIPTLFGPDVKISIGGGEAVSLALTQLVTKSQMISLVASLVCVFVLVLYFLRSFKLAFLALVPCAFALLSIFTAMAFLSIKIDVITSLLASLAIGVGVDYAIHLISALQRQEKQLGITVKAIVVNAASVTLGFLGLLFSQFVPVNQMGLLFSLSMVSAALSSLTIITTLYHIKPQWFIRRTT